MKRYMLCLTVAMILAFAYNQVFHLKGTDSLLVNFMFAFSGALVSSIWQEEKSV